ncbi:MAG: STAS domain-containing protein [Proteobacteria bacterium]|nr:STAS domain-containing protein [Pseudomonadota bacterium]
MNAVKPTGGIDMFQLPERMDSATASGIEQDLLAGLRPGTKLIVDGSAVTYMSAAGVRALATVLHGAQAREAQVVFCRFSGSAADCLEVSGFSQLLDVTESVEAARERLQSTSADRSKRLHQRGSAG